MNSAFKILSLFICASLVFLLCGCRDEKTGSGETVTGAETGTEISQTVISTGAAEITVGYIKTDSFSPYKAKSVINSELIFLLHAGLFRLESDLSVSPVIAKAYTVDKNAITVTIKDNAVFSDNTPVSADSVVRSFNAAKNSFLYSKQLESVISARAASNKEVCFTLADADVFALNLLTFPIIKSDTDNPVGAGKYSIEYKDKEPYLKLNGKSELYTISQNNKILLCDVSDGVNGQYAFMTRRTSVYIDTLDDNEYSKLSSKTAPVETAKLVFIGVNSKSGISSWPWLRRALNIGINRTKVGGSALLGQSVPAATPFHPSLFELRGLEITDAGGDKARAVRIMEENGFSSLNSSGYRKKGGIALTLRVLVSDSNPLKVSLAEALREDMKELGIKINIDRQPRDKYLETLKSGGFDLYIGEINLCPNLALDSFFIKEGAVSFGISEQCFADYFAFKRSETVIGEYIESFYTEVPFIPVCYRRSVMSYDKAISGVETSFGDPYYSVYFWSVSE